MINDKKVLALITARGGSKGLPRKNILEVHGKPLIVWSIETAKKSKYIDRLIVSTDDTEIVAVCREHGADVPFMRPQELSSDTASSIDVALHAIKFLGKEEYDYLVLLEPTSPLRTVQDIDKALENLDKSDAESIVGVGKQEATHPRFSIKISENGLLEPYLKNQKKHVRRQDLDDLYFLEGTIYASTVGALFSKRSFCHDKTLPYVVERYKQFEVDEEMDIYIIEAMMKYREDMKDKK